MPLLKGPGSSQPRLRVASRRGFLEHDPEKLQTFRIKSCDRNMQEHNPEKLQTFRIRSCDRSTKRDLEKLQTFRIKIMIPTALFRAGV